jgi:hypothetical protein
MGRFSSAYVIAGVAFCCAVAPALHAAPDDVTVTFRMVSVELGLHSGQSQGAALKNLQTSFNGVDGGGNGSTFFQCGSGSGTGCQPDITWFYPEGGVCPPPPIAPPGARCVNPSLETSWKQAAQIKRSAGNSAPINVSLQIDTAGDLAPESMQFTLRADLTTGAITPDMTAPTTGVEIDATTKLPHLTSTCVVSTLGNRLCWNGEVDVTVIFELRSLEIKTSAFVQGSVSYDSLETRIGPTLVPAAGQLFECSANSGAFCDLGSHWFWPRDGHCPPLGVPNTPPPRCVNQSSIEEKWKHVARVKLDGSPTKTISPSIIVGGSVADTQKGISFRLNLNPVTGEVTPVLAPPFNGLRTDGQNRPLLTKECATTNTDFILCWDISVEAPPLLPMFTWDVVFAEPPLPPLDINGRLFNPRWSWQSVSPAAWAAVQRQTPFGFDGCRVEACTQQETTPDPPRPHDDPLSCDDDTKGHLNWKTVTYEAPIFWEDYSGNVFGDDDYNMLMHTPVTNGFASGTTATNDPLDSVKLEFKKSETVDRFAASPLWFTFRAAVDAELTNPLMVNGRDAIAIGLLGLDREHESASELHPVYGLAIHLPPNDLAHDTWLVFARNFGNEGWCSSNMHYLVSDSGGSVVDMLFDLPRPDGVAASVTPVIKPEFVKDFTMPPEWEFFPRPNGGPTMLIFHLPSPAPNGLEGQAIAGRLVLDWTGTSGPAPAPASEQAEVAEAPAPRTHAGESEEALARLFAQLTPEQRATYLALMPPAPPVVPATPATPPPGSIRTSPPTAIARSHVVSVEDERMSEHRKDVHRSFCGALGGHVPDTTSSCALFTPATLLAVTGTPSATGWLTTPAVATLTAIDVNGAGIDHTEYSFDGRTWLRYAAPFTLPEGVITLFYRSQDRPGVFEAINQRSFKVDTVAPGNTLAIGLPQYAAGPPVVVSSMTPFQLSATDATSGVASVAYRFFAPGGPVPAFNVQNGNTAQFVLTGADGVYQVETLATDVAGNTMPRAQTVRLSNSADLAVVSQIATTTLPPFVLVGTPLSLAVKTVVTDLGLAHPVNAVLTRSVTATNTITVTPNVDPEPVAALELNEQRAISRTYTVSCLARSSNPVSFASRIALGADAGTIRDPNPGNDARSLGLTIACKVPWKPGTAYRVGDEVVFGGLVYVARQAHTSQSGWEPPNTYALWRRTETGGVWAIQVVYDTGDVVSFQGHHYKAIQGHQSQPGWEPPTTPALWQKLD